MYYKNYFDEIYEICDRTLNMSEKDAYIRNIDILLKKEECDFKDLLILKDELLKYNDIWSYQENNPEEISARLLGVNLFDFDRFDLFMIAHTYAWNEIVDCFSYLFKKANDISLLKWLYDIQIFIFTSLFSYTNCRSENKNKVFYCREFKSFLDERKNKLKTIKEKIDQFLKINSNLDKTWYDD